MERLRRQHTTGSSLKDMHDELVFLRSDCKLKDDTIKFLQQEKEKLVREVQHYEKLCAGVENSICLNAQSAAETARLREELDKSRETLRRQRLQIRSLSSSSSVGACNEGSDEESASHGALGASVCSRLVTLLRSNPGASSRSLQRTLSDEAHRYGRVGVARPELCLELIATVDQALAELCEHLRRQQRQGSTHLVALAAAAGDWLPDDGGDTQPVLRYAYGSALAPGGYDSRVESVYGRLSSEEIMIARRQQQQRRNARNGRGARAATAPSQSPAFVSLDRGTVLPGLKPVSAARR